MQNIQKVLLILFLMVLARAQEQPEKIKKRKVVGFKTAYHKKCDMANEATEEMTLCNYHAPACCDDCENHSSSEHVQSSSELESSSEIIESSSEIIIESSSELESSSEIIESSSEIIIESSSEYESSSECECSNDEDETHGTISSYFYSSMFSDEHGYHVSSQEVYDYEYSCNETLIHQHNITVDNGKDVIIHKKIKEKQVSYFNYSSKDGNGTHNHKIIVYDTYEYLDSNGEKPYKDYSVSKDDLNKLQEEPDNYWDKNQHMSSTQQVIRVIETHTKTMEDKTIDQVENNGVRHLRRVVDYDDYINDEKVWEKYDASQDVVNQ